jgi:hypothetical protein
LQARTTLCLNRNGKKFCALTWILASMQLAFGATDLLVSTIVQFAGKSFSQGSMRWYAAISFLLAAVPGGRCSLNSIVRSWRYDLRPPLCICSRRETILCFIASVVTSLCLSRSGAHLCRSRRCLCTALDTASRGVVAARLGLQSRKYMSHTSRFSAGRRLPLLVHLWCVRLE